MKKKAIYVIRLIIILFLFLPVLLPFINQKENNLSQLQLQILIPADINLKYEQKNNLKKLMTDYFSPDIDIHYNSYGKKNNTPIQDYEDLLQLIDKSRGQIIIISDAILFGENSLRFNKKLKESSAFKEKRIFFLPLEKVVQREKRDEEYIVISDIFIPKISFLGEESIATVSLIGKAKSNSKFKIEVTLHTGNSFLNSKTVELIVPENSLIRQSVDIPINFAKTGTQVITADINSTFAHAPLNSASTSVQVVYSKTTVLHISVGPDWSLRSIRQKLKFWPNLDLLSYYILREINSDQSIPSSQLSLIEFPAEKLFGNELQNFHGIVAQNFLFDTYLGEKESENLVNYVYNGGRLLIQAGPLTFLSENQSIKSLFPCENEPKWDMVNTYHWTTNETDFISNSSFSKGLEHIVTHATALQCKPKKEAVVLAKTAEGNHPILLAMPAQKGIVLSFLAGDWLNGYTQESLNKSNENTLRMRNADSSEAIFNWMIEFLQRRQDSGIRAPDILGPRLYAQEKFIDIRNRGGIQLGKPVSLSTSNNKSIKGIPFNLKKLEKEMIEFSSPLSSIISLQNSNKGSSTIIELALGQINADKSILKFGNWPVFPQTAKEMEKNENPFLFENIPLLTKAEEATKENTTIVEKTPLLNAFPWLLALALALLCFEQFLTRILWKEEI
ncbi:hypothetical protein [Fluviispira multicolorata]|uniref:Uncharacterized protein n=1 Tax=Fluviispira multicolorata TaxID=2654512 RepID=A0A833JG58_9BACT|nr:hypothetical protein [Fluviispira multicolorata]KAB8033768.1 hypothetical protein GCL57_03410 [Fluviispira multicolorata]